MKTGGGACHVCHAPAGVACTDTCDDSRVPDHLVAPYGGPSDCKCSIKDLTSTGHTKGCGYLEAKKAASRATAKVPTLTPFEALGGVYICTRVPPASQCADTCPKHRCDADHCYCWKGDRT